MDGITFIVNYIHQLLSVILNMYIHYCLHSGKIIILQDRTRTVVRSMWVGIASRDRWLIVVCVELITLVT